MKSIKSSDVKIALILILAGLLVWTGEIVYAFLQLPAEQSAPFIWLSSVGVGLSAILLYFVIKRREWSRWLLATLILVSMYYPFKLTLVQKGIGAVRILLELVGLVLLF